MNLAYSDKISDQIAPQPTTRWLVTILLLGTLFIFYVTLFPFDFFLKSPPTLNDIIQNFDLDIFNLLTIKDIPRNIILFIPIGFAVGGALLKQRISYTLTFVITVFVGLLFSATVEVLQMYSIARFPTLDDILANTFGTFVGVIIFIKWGTNLYLYWSQFLNWLNNKLSFRLLSLCYILFVIVILAISLLLREQTKFSNWVTDFPLIIGNESTENRPWQGSMTSLYLVDQAATESTIEKLFEGSDIRVFYGGSNSPLVAYYDFTNNGTHNYPTLAWQGTPAFGVESTGAQFSSRQWLKSEGSAYKISNALRDSSEFTLGLIAAPANLEQSGPARLFSISGNIMERNLTIGQSGADLNLRIRTPFSDDNGRTPEFVIPNVFTDTELQHIIITYTGTTLQLFIDDPANVYTIELVPAVVLFSLFPPSKIEQMRINRGNMLVFHLLYNALYLVPLAGLLVYKLRGSHYKPIWNWVSILLTTAVASLLLEVGLNLLISGYRLQTNYVLMNMPLFLCATGYFWWLTRPHLQENLV